MEESTAKIVSMCLLGLVSLFLGMIPIAIVRKLKWGSMGEGMSPTMKSILSATLCFGGGVLMGLALIHLLPEIHEGFEKLMQSNHVEVNFPVGIVVICAGFFIVYFIEEVVHLIADRHAHNVAEASLHRTVSIRGCPVGRGGPVAPCSTEEVECRENSICQLDCHDKEFCRQVGNEEEARRSFGSCDQLVTSVKQKTDAPQSADPTAHSKVNINDCYGTFRPVDEDHHVDHDHRPGDRRNDKKHSKAPGSGMSISVVMLPETPHANPPNWASLHHGGLGHGHGHGDSPHHHHGLATKDGHCVGASLRGLIVIVALSLHEVLEGLAVGLQRDTSDIWQLFAAVASHKYVISFCVGVELATTGVAILVHSVYILVFSLVTPLGIGIGIALTNSNDGDMDNSTVSLVLEGLACGTIVYVAFFEILERERSKSTAGLLQWFLLLLGFLCILGLQSIGEHDHDHDHDHGHVIFDGNATIFTNSTHN